MIESIRTFINTHPLLFLVVGVVSIALLLLSLILVPFVVVRLPEDYFIRPKSKPEGGAAALRIALSLFRNVLAFVLIPLGVLLLVLPGPGLATILLGVELLDIPLKRILEMKLLAIPRVRHAVNALRAQRGEKPLRFPESR